ncbi:right-handed parallel beta-helix repeat-containing protein [Halobacterium zhouii]|uniref:right-handed parallel beta-helix repeat-containing protein n=1 Tax=Halobacterium zhouii TaxID=2902624 RepID=UPI001E2C17D5|nr:right-handed parallel beta-helix repeat-containing protein [Halobacterium zhouii]
MASDESQSYDDKDILTSRRGFAKLLASGVAGASLLSAGAVDRAAAATTVNLGDEGLQSGDVIDDYLAQHLESGVEVRVPAGTYEWQGSGLDGSYQNAALVGEGDVSFDFTGDYWNVNAFAVGGGDFTIRNVTVRGPINSNDNKSRFRFDARDPDSTVTLDNFNLPDGEEGKGRAIGIYVGHEHQGHVHLTNCHVEGFPNNGLYAGPYGKPDGGGGQVTVEKSFFKNNNIDAVRLGGTGDTIRDCVIVQDEVPAYYNGAKSGRGVRVRYPGENVTIENVHITSNASSPFLVPSRANGPSGNVKNLYIENNTGGTAAYVESGSFTADTVHVTGSGNQNVTGFESATNVVSGSSAESPATSLSELDIDIGSGDITDGTSTDSGGESTGTTDSDDTSGNGSSGGDTSSLEHTLTVEGSTSGEKHYHFETSGEVQAGSMINPDDTVNTSSVDGTMFSSVDSYQFSGKVTEFTSDNLDELTVYVDGNRVDPASFNSYPNEIVFEGWGQSAKDYAFAVSGEVDAGGDINPDDSVSESSVDGAVWWSVDHYSFSGDLTELNVPAPDDVTVTVNGTEIDPAEFGSEPLPNRLVVDGTRATGEATYSFEVSDTVEKSTDLGDLEASDQISGTTVTGTVGDELDAYRFAGDLESVDVDGAALITIEQTN